MQRLSERLILPVALLAIAVSFDALFGVWAAIGYCIVVGPIVARLTALDARRAQRDTQRDVRLAVYRAGDRCR